MNIFYLDNDPKKSAELLADCHVCKMTVETAQILCTAHHILDTGYQNTNKVKFYKLTHKNHPCIKWTLECKNNYMWLAEYGVLLCREYTYRYKKIHASQDLMHYLYLNPPAIQVLPKYTPPALAMPDIYKEKDPIQSYKNYYNYKQSIMKMNWTNRNKPKWMT